MLRQIKPQPTGRKPRRRRIVRLEKRHIKRGGLKPGKDQRL
jgi:hypothetical protein